MSERGVPRGWLRRWVAKCLDWVDRPAIYRFLWSFCTKIFAHYIHIICILFCFQMPRTSLYGQAKQMPQLSSNKWQHWASSILTNSYPLVKHTFEFKAFHLNLLLAFKNLTNKSKIHRSHYRQPTPLVHLPSCLLAFAFAAWPISNKMACVLIASNAMRAQRGAAFERKTELKCVHLRKRDGHIHT